MAGPTLLDLPSAGVLSSSDKMYIVQGAGAGRDKQVELGDLLAFYNIVVVANQTQFEAIIERTGANQYKFIDDVDYVIFRYLAGGYQFNSTSGLSGGDAYGTLSTNNVKFLKMAGGAFIDFNDDLRSKLSINGEGVHIDGFEIQGSTSTAGTVDTSLITFTAAALNAKLNNITIKNIKTNLNVGVDHFTIRGSGTAATDVTIQLSNISFENWSFESGYGVGTDVQGFFKDLKMLNNISFKDITTVQQASGLGSFISMFDSCENISNVNLYNLQYTAGGSNQSGWCIANNCKNINNIDALTINAGSYFHAFNECINISNINLDTISFDGTTETGPIICYDCDSVSNIYISNFSWSGTSISLFNISKNIKNVILNNTSLPSLNISFFDTCENIDGLILNSISGTRTNIATDSNLISNINISGNVGANSNTDTTYFFDNCDCIKNVRVTSTQDDLWFFNDCNHISGVYAVGSGVTGNTLKTVCYNCKHVEGINIEDYDEGGLFKFDTCYGISNLHITNIDVDAIMNNCRNINNVLIDGLEAFHFTNTRLFVSCLLLSNVRCINNTATVTNAAGAGSTGINFFYQCECLVNCSVDNYTESGSTTTHLPRFFELCSNLSGCIVRWITGGIANYAYGFSNCRRLAACFVDNLIITTVNQYAVGFFDCDYLSSCVPDTISGGTFGSYGFQSCKYIAASNTPVTSNPSNDYVDTNDTNITNKHSTPVNGDGIWT